MGGPGTGHEFPPEDVSWLKRDVLLFANSIGCTADELHFLYVWLIFHEPLLCRLFRNVILSDSLTSSRSSIPTSPSSRLIQSSCVGLPRNNSPEIYTDELTPPGNSFQGCHTGSNRFLCQIRPKPHPRRPEIRPPPDHRWPAYDAVSQAPPPHVRRQAV